MNYKQAGRFKKREDKKMKKEIRGCEYCKHKKEDKLTINGRTIYWCVNRGKWCCSMIESREK